MELQTALTTLIMPPFAPLVGLLLAFSFWFFPNSTPVAKLSLPLAILCFLTLWICATPAFSGWLGQRLVNQLPAVPDAKPTAVVILGGGRYRDAQTGSERLSSPSLERVAWAVAKAPGSLPILVSGGRVYAQEKAAESDLMADALEKLFGRTVTWRENCSRTTAENAAFSAALLHDSGVESVLLVTHWWHMPRAQEVFARAGIQVQPLAVGSPGELMPRAQTGLLRWLPSAGALLRTQVYWRELLADQWYRWRPLPVRRNC
ncbi:YdcF family protein [Microbulbifer bruguierae]|uniref:YdcF family protein n=1 Tax=Microbulbifer bruguierae TaxID=3029061 RepID=A0ABY8NF53_9GAMM|nr:YdcF family protein [Microbulbifer bruguierae]WGL17565.1 YdcF family protein [Microbulbifer bruguierae]